MDEPFSQEKLPDEVKKPLRITLTLTTTRGDIGSLDALWKALLTRRMFEMAGWQRARSQEDFTILSNTADLSIGFPNQQSSRTLIVSCAIGAVIGFILFRLSAMPLLGVPAMAVLSGLAGILVSRRSSTEFTVRGDLPDIIRVSDTLALWLSANRDRKVHLETWEKARLEADARTAEELKSMFVVAIAAQERGCN
jgi:hypothetical protein